MSEPDAPAGRLPDFLIIGATKAGTTSLFDYLARHPQAFMHPKKEMRFFLEENHRARGQDWYAAQFADAGGVRVAGEASNAYSRHPVHEGVSRRVAALLPGARLIYLTREPFARLESHYRWRLTTGYEWRSPEEAFQADTSYVAASLYGLQLAEWRRHYPADRILVLRCEALFEQPRRHLARLCEFLGLDFDPRLPFRRRNPTEERRAMPEPLRRMARGPLRKPVRRLGRIATRGPLRLGRTASEVEYHITDELHHEIAHLFREDRPLLAELAGADAVRWPPRYDPAVSAPRLRRVPGFAERPAGWLGAELGLPTNERKALP